MVLLIYEEEIWGGLAVTAPKISEVAPKPSGAAPKLSEVAPKLSPGPRPCLVRKDMGALAVLRKLLTNISMEWVDTDPLWKLIHIVETNTPYIIRASGHHFSHCSIRILSNELIKRHATNYVTFDKVQSYSHIAYYGSL